MGWFSWIFPSEEERIASAKKMLEAGRAADARLEVLDIDHVDARAVLKNAEDALARLNLEAALSWADAGDDRRVATHLELAESFHTGGLEEEFAVARRRMRALRTQRSEADEKAKHALEHKQRSADPLGITGGANWLQDPIPDDLYDADRDELEARLALTVEGYPDDLRPAVTELGVEFAKAVLDIEDGRADRALQSLLALDDQAPLVRWERSRCCHALGDPRATVKEIRAFAEIVGGHRQMSRQHSGELLAQLTVELGDAPGALRILRSVRATDPDVGGVLFAQLLTVTGAHREAELTLVALIRKHPRTQVLYALLAQTRLAGGEREQAMRALEASMEAICCTPGKCGSQPPRQDILRMLATLYLEDSIQIERALDLGGQALGMVQKPQWEDLYLRALCARAEHSAEASSIISRLHSLTPEGDNRQARLSTYLPA
jgi:hypothetical protein